MLTDKSGLKNDSKLMLPDILIFSLSRCKKYFINNLKDDIKKGKADDSKD